MFFFLCLLAVFKNEAHILKEWVEHYIKEGVDKFFLINNNSNDNFYEILLPYINDGIVTLTNDERYYSQVTIYNDYITDCKKYKWVIVCDLDEFIYARNGFKRIKQYLKTIDNNVSQVCIPWKIFGSNGYNTIDKEQPVSVIKTFTKRINYDKNEDFQGVIKKDNNKYSFNKCIVRTNKLSNFDIHNHIVTNGNHTTSDNKNTICPNNNAYSKIDERILKSSTLQLNHYAIQSLQWFMKVKVTRGDNTTSIQNNTRNEAYFIAFDNASNDIDDSELANKLY
jgi:hypothetical protein